MHVERISRDETFFGNMKLKLDTFFLKAILPKILLGPESNDDRMNHLVNIAIAANVKSLP